MNCMKCWLQIKLHVVVKYKRYKIHYSRTRAGFFSRTSRESIPGDRHSRLELPHSLNLIQK